MTKIILLQEGFGYAEINSAFDVDKEGNELRTTKGDPKLTLILTVADSRGAVGTIYDTISPAMPWKIANLANVLDIPDLFADGKFNCKALVRRSLACCIANEEWSGKLSSKIAMYVPREFVELCHYNGLSVGQLYADALEGKEPTKVDWNHTTHGRAYAAQQQKELNDDDIPF